MKNYLKLIFLLTLTLNAISCNKTDTQVEKNEVGTINFNGLIVKHNYSTPKEALFYDVEDLQLLYIKKANIATKSIDSISYPSLDEFTAIEVENLKKYPDFDELSENDVEVIKNDFPTLTDKEINENIKTISEYYIKNLQYDLINELAKRDALTKSYSGTELSSKEFWFLSTRPTAAVQINKATNDAKSYTHEMYNRSIKGDQSDAFRHIIWNVLIAKYYGDKKNSVDDGVRMAENFTKLHEYGSLEENNNVYNYDTEMDFHNNLIGRDYFKKVAVIKEKKRTLWFTKKWLECPDNNTIKSDIKEKVDEGELVEKNISEMEKVPWYRAIFYIQK